MVLIVDRCEHINHTSCAACRPPLNIMNKGITWFHILISLEKTWFCPHTLSQFADLFMAKETTADSISNILLKLNIQMPVNFSSEWSIIIGIPFQLPSPSLSFLSSFIIPHPILWNNFLAVITNGILSYIIFSQAAFNQIFFGFVIAFDALATAFIISVFVSLFSLIREGACPSKRLGGIFRIFNIALLLFCEHLFIAWSWR